jgi:hypothetical protein
MRSSEVNTHRNRLPVVMTLMALGSQVNANVGAAELAPFSSVDLHKRCLAYLESPQSDEGQQCSAYVRGFIQGSQQIVLRDEDVEQKPIESFTDRALRTRLGKPGAPRPDYCVSSTTTLREFISQMIAHAEINPPKDDVSASVLLYGTLTQFHRCPA